MDEIITERLNVTKMVFYEHLIFHDNILSILTHAHSYQKLEKIIQIFLNEI